MALGAAAALALVACDDHGAAARADAPHFVEKIVAPRRAIPGELPPLLVMLHGLGSNESDLVPIGTELDPRLLIVGVRAPRPYHQGFAWFRIDWRPDGSLVPDLAQAKETLGDVARWLGEAPTRLGADPKQVYLFGFSQGAMMSLGVLRTAPEHVAGVIALSGKFDDALFGKTRASPAAIARVALFVAHGTDDDLLPVRDGRAIRDLFDPVVRDFTYHEYPIPHAIAPTEVHDIATWLTDHLDHPNRAER